MHPGSRSRLTAHTLPRFSGETLFDRIAQAVCRAECLPRKELYEAWEMARRIRRHYRGGRVVDMACGHGLLAWILLILDQKSKGAVCVDKRLPESHGKLHRALCENWPHLGEKITYVEGDMAMVDLGTEDLVVSAHACGGLTDRVLALAMASGCRVAVLPCCHSLERNDTGHLEGWMEGALAIDAVRAIRLAEAGYEIRTRLIPAAVTPKNRLLMGAPCSVAKE